ncbi:LysR family transcriptional regulator [Saccharothrix algeriensis]|uniref:DNA-binding transcriptional LysR family regulator n=1 Tax=Saccharothrix algeriensis TaxID=173560 RepID=A0A8T8HY77_9PSEU|nr:LysR family transcriptional regulator [Saccharothrix algeriensis]MBM7815210.1 DNA-binding transcriptional LysR family regulator [Saccharothrix algeriensis]QTR03446.1 LysR family transcriptional regulator [Saccharothrix algeriensis]
MFGLERMRALHAVATHGTVAAAATALHITPSGVSQQLAKLEREAGQRLLEPHGRTVRLTTAGHLLAGHAAGILARVEKARSDLELLREDITGPLRVGAIPTTVHALLPPVLAALRAQHPGLEVTLHEGEAEETMPQVVDGRLDVAVLESWEHRPTTVPPSTSRTTLLSDVADLALPASHRLAHRKAVDLAEVDDIPWIAWSAGSGCHAWLTHVLRQQGTGTRITCTVGSYPTQLALVAGNVGAAVIPRLGRDSVPDGVRILTTRPALNRTIYAINRAEDDDRGAIRACVDALASAATRFHNLA